MIHKLSNEKSKIGIRALWYMTAFFFLNRIVSTSIFENNSFLDEGFVLVSEVLTVIYFFKWAWCLLKKNKIYLSEISCILSVAAYFILMLSITFVRDGNIRRIFMTAYPIIGTLCFLDVESKSHSKELLNGLYCFFTIMLIYNFIDMIFVRNVLSVTVVEFLIGGRDQLGMFLAISTSIIGAFYEDNKDMMSFISKLFNVMVHLLILLTAILSGSATTLVVLLVVYVLYICFILKININILNPTFVILVYVFFWISLIVLRLQYLASNLIVNVLHKDITLSHRTILWDEALRLIKLKPFFGYGMSDSVDVFTVNHDYTGGNNNVLSTLSSHNEILQIMYYGGITLVISFLILYFVCCSLRRRCNSKFILFFYAVIGILLVWLSEVPGEYAMFFALGLCYYSKELDGRVLDNERFNIRRSSNI